MLLLLLSFHHAHSQIVPAWKLRTRHLQLLVVYIFFSMNNKPYFFSMTTFYLFLAYAISFLQCYCILHFFELHHCMILCTVIVVLHACKHTLGHNPPFGAHTYCTCCSSREHLLFLRKGRAHILLGESHRSRRRRRSRLTSPASR